MWGRDPLPLDDCSFEERRRLVRAGGYLSAPHAPDCDRACDDLRHICSYRIFGAEIDLEFPNCLHAWWWPGSKEMNYLGKLVGVKWETGGRLEVMFHHHSRGPFGEYYLPEALQRGAHYYYVLRDVAKLLQKTVCCVCRTRVRRSDDWERKLERRIGTEANGFTPIYNYYCSERCRQRFHAQRRRDAKREELNLLWIKKGKQRLNQVRALCRNPARLPEA